jgi:hypothetical protein
MLFSAQPIGADEALRGGLVSEVVRVGAGGGAETAAGSASAGSSASASGSASAAAGSATGSAASAAVGSATGSAGSVAASAASAASAPVAHGHHGNGARDNQAATIGTGNISDGDRLIAATRRRVTELARAIAAYSPHILQLGKAAVLEQVRMLAVVCCYVI